MTGERPPSEGQVTCLGWVDAQRRMFDDKKLLFQAGEDPRFIPRVLLYRFRRPTITLGRHTRLEDLFGTGREQRMHRLITRRATGGGAIFHAGGICFTLITRRAGQWQDRHGSIFWLRGMISEGLSSLGVFTQSLDGPVPETARRLGTWCAYEGADSDILVGGKKLGGIAQRVLKNALLLEGYLTLRRRECTWMNSLTHRRASRTASIAPVSLEEVLGRPIPAGTVLDALSEHGSRLRSLTT